MSVCCGVIDIAPKMHELLWTSSTETKRKTYSYLQINRPESIFFQFTAFVQLWSCTNERIPLIMILCWGQIPQNGTGLHNFLCCSSNTVSDTPLSSLLVWLLRSTFQEPSDNRACEMRELKNAVDSLVACVSDFCYGLGWHLGRHSDPLMLLYGCWNVTAVSNYDVNDVWRQCWTRKLWSCAVQLVMARSSPEAWMLNHSLLQCHSGVSTPNKVS
jgi:hypothetical protein